MQHSITLAEFWNQFIKLFFFFEICRVTAKQPVKVQMTIVLVQDVLNVTYD